jgi:hypothetical protein
MQEGFELSPRKIKDACISATLKLVPISVGIARTYKLGRS